MKKFLTSLALLVLRRFEVDLIPAPNKEYVSSALEFILHVEKQNEPWEWKHRQAIRALMNRFPSAKIRDLNFAIEVAIQKCSVSGY